MNLYTREATIQARNHSHQSVGPYGAHTLMVTGYVTSLCGRERAWIPQLAQLVEPLKFNQEVPGLFGS